MKVSAEQIRTSVERWRGNLQAASKELGIARNNLYKRVSSMGLDLDAIRRGQPSDPALPIRGMTKKVRMAMVVRLTAAQLQHLREARWDLQARFRVDLDDHAVLGQFFDEAFDGWLRGKLEGKAAS